MAGVPQAGAHLWTQHDNFYTLFLSLTSPFSPVSPLAGYSGFTILSEDLIGSLSGVQCSSCPIDKVICLEFLLNKEYGGEGRCPIFSRHSPYHVVNCSFLNWQNTVAMCEIYSQCWLYIYTYILL